MGMLNKATARAHGAVDQMALAAGFLISRLTR